MRLEVTTMELLLLALLALATLGALMAHRHHQLAVWNRELEQAFGPSAGRDVSRHRRL